MELSTDTVNILECPACRKPVKVTADQLVCTGCSVGYPVIQGIPWFLRNPKIQLIQWQARINKLLNRFHLEISFIDDELRNVEILDETKDRLKRLHQAYVENEKHLRNYLSSLWQPTEQDQSFSLAQALTDKVGNQQTIESYFNNIFRDWAWESDENGANLSALKSVIPMNSNFTNTLVMGCGSGRLVADLHQELQCKNTIAVDINPLLLFLFRDMLAGKSVDLWEVPVSPMYAKNIAHKWTLKSKGTLRPGVQYLFADALNLPLQAKSVDCLITPWFIDIVKQDLKKVIQRINRHLTPGGHWINFGPLGFQHSQVSENYSLEETEKLVLEQGFEIQKLEVKSIPYLCSPLSGQKRYETVVIFCARKVKDCKEPAFYSPIPDWITDIKKPIPLSATSAQELSRYQVGFQILGSINGKNSVETIAGMMAKSYGISFEQAIEVISGFLVEIFEA